MRQRVGTDEFNKCVDSLQQTPAMRFATRSEVAAFEIADDLRSPTDRVAEQHRLSPSVVRLVSSTGEAVDASSVGVHLLSFLFPSRVPLSR